MAPGNFLIRFLWAVITIGTIVDCSPVASRQIADDLRALRERFQTQELTLSKSGGWIFAIGNTPRIIWRDVDEVRRLGAQVDFETRWFDDNLEEAHEPDHAGRWMAWLSGIAPNGLPFRRALTFYALPQKIETEYRPDLTIVFPNFPGPNAPPAWREHQQEFDRLARDLVVRALMESERGAILAAGLTESQPLGRAKRYVESTEVMNDDRHLALKLKLFNLADQVRPLRPPQVRATPAPVLRKASLDQAGVPSSAKQKIDDYCRQWAAATNEPFVIVVARRGVIITHEAFGVDSQGTPIDRDYRSWVASITKTVTATLFSQFVDQQLIELDAPISSVFPDFPKNSPQVPTFRQLLNHTSGLSGHGEFGGMHNPHLENIILNAIDVNEPGKVHQYCGRGFELAVKAMEIVCGKSAARIFDDHLFRPLGFGDVVMGNASSDGEFTAMELAILGQYMLNRGSYGELQFITPETFAEFLPQPLPIAGAIDEQGLGVHPIRHLRAGAPADAKRPEDLCFSPQTIGHGSLSGSVFVVDLEQELVITQSRRAYRDADNVWFYPFFQVVADAIAPDPRHSAPADDR